MRRFSCFFPTSEKPLKARPGFMIGENRQLVTDGPVEVHQDCRRITGHFGGICRIYPNLIKENRRVSTCKWLDLQTLGSQPIMPKNLPDH